MLTLMLSNESLRRELITESMRAGLLAEQALPLEASKYPAVDRLVCLYGLLSRPDPQMFAHDASWWDYISGVVWTFAVRLYAPCNDAFFGGRVMLCDFDPNEVSGFARRTFLACGRSDPLLGATYAAQSFFDAAGHPCETMIVPGTHAFQGIPSMWLGKQWEVNALPVTRRMVNFCAAKGSGRQLPVLDPLPFDWTPIIIMPISVAACCGFAWCTAYALRLTFHAAFEGVVVLSLALFIVLKFMLFHLRRCGAAALSGSFRDAIHRAVLVKRSTA